MFPVSFPQFRAKLLTFFLLSLVLPAAAVSAAVLVYEGFNGYTVGGLAGVNPNGNTIGLDTTVGYYDGPSARTDNFSIQSTGLSLGSLTTAGGALHFTTGTNVIGADIEIGATAYTGTLWGSYLVNLTTSGSSASDGAVLRIGSTPADSNNSHFNSWADSRSSSPNIAVGYNSSGSNGSGALTLGTTYIIISKFTRVGQSINVSSPGVATQWALNETQFASFIAAGADEAALNSVTITATSTQSATSGSINIFSSAMAFSIVTVNDVGTFDEIRFSSDLAGATPFAAIPEPATAALLIGLGSITLYLTQRRRQAGA